MVPDRNGANTKTLIGSIRIGGLNRWRANLAVYYKNEPDDETEQKRSKKREATSSRPEQHFLVELRRKTLCAMSASMALSSMQSAVGDQDCLVPLTGWCKPQRAIWAAHSKTPQAWSHQKEPSSFLSTWASSQMRAQLHLIRRIDQDTTPIDIAAEYSVFNQVVSVRPIRPVEPRSDYSALDCSWCLFHSIYSLTRHTECSSRLWFAIVWRGSFDYSLFCLYITANWISPVQTLITATSDWVHWTHFAEFSSAAPIGLSSLFNLFQLTSFIESLLTSCDAHCQTTLSLSRTTHTPTPIAVKNARYRDGQDLPDHSALLYSHTTSLFSKGNF